MIRIVVDSSADYQAEEIREKNLDLVTIAITVGEKQYVDGVNLDRNQFYELLEETGEFPKTSQPSPQQFLDIFLDAKEKGDEVVCITLSSALSGTYQSALLAKDMAEYDPIYIVDSRTATCNIKILADYARKLADDGHGAGEIAEQVEGLKSRVKVVAALDTLEYLSRGGRLSRTAAALGDMAGLKPLITITEEGEVSMLGKALGKNKAISHILRHLEERKLDQAFPVYSIYSYGTENCVRFEEKLESKGIPITERLQIGATIGAHIGPEAFGIIFVEQ